MAVSGAHDTSTPIVLIVEDDPVLQLMTAHILKNALVETTVASSVAEARDYLASGHADVVVADYLMPGEDGLALIPDCAERGIPFILLSGTAEEDYASDPRFDGVMAHLTKPASSQDLQAAVDNALRKKSTLV